MFYDAEHFFDGYRANPDYALETLRPRPEAGAAVVILCDTNGGTMPEQVAEAVAHAKAAVGCEVGIHCHNDCELAVANTLAAVRAGATQVQGTDERHRRALRQRGPGQRRRQPGAEVRLRRAAARQPGPADGGVAGTSTSWRT